jgi:hypothetical protein
MLKSVDQRPKVEGQRPKKKGQRSKRAGRKKKKQKKKEKYEGFPRPGGDFVAPGNNRNRYFIYICFFLVDVPSAATPSVSISGILKLTNCRCFPSWS